MALDTRGLASGFGQGFGLADNYYRGQKQDDRAERGLQMREESFGMQKDQYEQARQKEQATLIFGKVANKMGLSEDEEKFLVDNPRYLGALNSETDKAIDIAQRVIDPNDPTGFNSEEGMYAMNTAFAPVINRGQGGSKRIVAGYPAKSNPEAMTFDLEVTGEDGSKVNRPMTDNRGIEGEDDQVKEVPIEGMVNHVQGLRMVRNAINSNGASEYAQKMYSVLTGKQTERSDAYRKRQEMVGLGIDAGEATSSAYGLGTEDSGEKVYDEELGGWIQKGPNNKIIPIDMPGANTSAGNMPAKAQMLELLVRTNIAKDYDEAWEKLNMANTNPAKFLTNYVDQEIGVQESSGIYPGYEGYKTTEQMRADAMEALKIVRGETPAPKGPPPPRVLDMRGLDPSLPSDGSAAQQGDGSYTGVINRDPQQLPANVAPAPAEAINYLKQNPGMAAEFRAKYNYLPEGF